MRGRIFTLLVGLALLAFAAPGLVGYLAARQLDDNLSWFDAENDDVEIAALDFRQGWFSSRATHRLVLHDPMLKTLLGLTSADAAPALLIDSRLDHGLLPLSTLKPGLASAVSTLRFEPAFGEPIAVPGAISSHIGLLGASTVRYAAGAGERRWDDLRAAWQDVDLVVTASARSQTLGVAGRIAPLKLESPDGAARIASLTLDSVRDASRYRFGVGRFELRVHDLALDADASIDGRLSEFAVAIDSGLRGDTLTGTATLELRDLVSPEAGTLELDLALDFAGLDAAAVERIAAKLAGHYLRPEPGDLSPAAPSLQPEFESLLTSGGRVEVTQLVAATNGAAARSSASVEWPRTAAGEPLALPSILLRTEAAAELSMDVALYDRLSGRVPQLSSLLALGFLARKGDRYEMQAELDGGLLTVNGTPMPLSNFR